MKTPHKHAECIKAWADGAEIEFRVKSWQDWADATCPSWDERYEYRIKPEPKPDIVRYIAPNRGSGYGHHFSDAKLKVVLDGETQKVLSVEIL